MANNTPKSVDWQGIAEAVQYAYQQKCKELEQARMASRNPDQEKQLQEQYEYGRTLTDCLNPIFKSVGKEILGLEPDAWEWSKGNDILDLEVKRTIALIHRTRMLADFLNEIFDELGSDIIGHSTNGWQLHQDENKLEAELRSNVAAVILFIRGSKAKIEGKC